MILKYQGRDVQAIPVEFLTRKEDFNEYQLVNGVILRMKTVVTRILLLEGEISPDGNQVYIINAQNVIAPLG